MDFDFVFSEGLEVRGAGLDTFGRGLVDFVAVVVSSRSDRCALANVPKSISASSADN